MQGAKPELSLELPRRQAEAACAETETSRPNPGGAAGSHGTVNAARPGAAQTCFCCFGKSHVCAQVCVCECACVRMCACEEKGRGADAAGHGALAPMAGPAAATRRTSGRPCRRGSTRSCSSSTTPAGTGAAGTSCACIHLWAEHTAAPGGVEGTAPQPRRAEETPRASSLRRGPPPPPASTPAGRRSSAGLGSVRLGSVPAPFCLRSAGQWPLPDPTRLCY